MLTKSGQPCYVAVTLPVATASAQHWRPFTYPLVAGLSWALQAAPWTPAAHSHLPPAKNLQALPHILQRQEGLWLRATAL